MAPGPNIDPVFDPIDPVAMARYEARFIPFVTPGYRVAKILAAEVDRLNGRVAELEGNLSAVRGWTRSRLKVLADRRRDYPETPENRAKTAVLDDLTRVLDHLDTIPAPDATATAQASTTQAATTESGEESHEFDGIIATLDGVIYLPPQLACADCGTTGVALARWVREGAPNPTALRCAPCALKAGDATINRVRAVYGLEPMGIPEADRPLPPSPSAYTDVTEAIAAAAKVGDCPMCRKPIRPNDDFQPTAAGSLHAGCFAEYQRIGEQAAQLADAIEVRQQRAAKAAPFLPHAIGRCKVCSQPVGIDENSGLPLGYSTAAGWLCRADRDAAYPSDGVPAASSEGGE